MPVIAPSSSVLGSGIFATRKPMVPLPPELKKLLRLDDDKLLLEKKYQPPPRMPRSEVLESFTKLKSFSCHSETLPPWPAVP